MGESKLLDHVTISTIVTCPPKTDPGRMRGSVEKEAQVLIEMWRKHYNMVRPHSSLGYKPPAPATVVVHPSQIQQISLTL